MKRFAYSLFLSFCLSTCALAQSVQGSQSISTGFASIAASPLMSIEGRPLEASATFGIGGAFIVSGLALGAAEIATITLKNLSTGSLYTIQVSTKAAQGASLAVDTSIRAVAEATGYALIASGKLLAFIPNAIGQSLLHQEQVK